MARCSRDNTCKSAMLISRSVTWSRFRYFRPLLAVWMEYPIYRRMWLILFNNNIIHIYMLRWLFISVDGIMHYRVWYKFSVLLASWSTCFSTFNWELLHDAGPCLSVCVCLQGAYAEAGSRLSSCLAALGRPLPTSPFDLAASLAWHAVRQLLHRLRLGRCLASRDRDASARDAALVYHKLLQLYLTGEWGGLPHRWTGGGGGGATSQVSGGRYHVGGGKTVQEGWCYMGVGGAMSFMPEILMRIIIWLNYLDSRAGSFFTSFSTFVDWVVSTSVSCSVVLA